MSDTEALGTASPAVDELSTSPVVAHLVAVAAHRLRNPLAAMSATLQLLMSRLGDDAPHREALDAIGADLDRLAGRIDDVVDTAAVPMASSETQDMVAVLDDNVARWRKTLPPSTVALHAAYDVASCPVPLARRELDQLFQYLLWLLTVTAPPPATVFVTTQTDGDGAVVCRLAQTTQPPTQAVTEEHPAMPGAAVGVAVCESIVKVSGCRFKAEADSAGYKIFSIIVDQQQAFS